MSLRSSDDEDEWDNNPLPNAGSYVADDWETAIFEPPVVRIHPSASGTIRVHNEATAEAPPNGDSWWFEEGEDASGYVRPAPEPVPEPIKEEEETIVRVVKVGDANSSIRAVMPYLLDHLAGIKKAQVSLSSTSRCTKCFPVGPFGDLAQFLRRAVAYAKTHSVPVKLTDLTRAVEKANEAMRTEAKKPEAGRDNSVLKNLAEKLKEKKEILEIAKKNMQSLSDHKKMTHQLQHFVDVCSRGNDSASELAEKFGIVHTKFTGTAKVATSAPVNVVVVKRPEPPVSAPAPASGSAPAPVTTSAPPAPFVSKFKRVQKT